MSEAVSRVSTPSHDPYDRMTFPTDNKIAHLFLPSELLDDKQTVSPHIGVKRECGAYDSGLVSMMVVAAIVCCLPSGIVIVTAP